MTALLDATAVVDVVTRGPGAERVQALLGDSRVLSVNWLEVLHWASRTGADPREWVGPLRATGVTVISFTADDAAAGPAVRDAEARVRGSIPARDRRGLSTADVACLATASARKLFVVTSDALMADVAAELGLDLLDHRAPGTTG